MAGRTHAWVRERLLDHVLGILPDDESAEVEAHLAECDPCRTAHEALVAARSTEPDPDPGAHVPTSLLARWHRAGALQGLEREAVVHHLETCDRCRQVLDILGFDPRLSAAPAAPPAPPRPAAVRPAIRRGFDWMRVGLGGWALGATALAVWLFVPHPPATPIGEPGRRSPEPAPLPSAAPAPATLALALLPRTESRERGADSRVPITPVPGAAGEFVLQVPVDDLPDGAAAQTVTATLTDPAGRVLLTATFTLGALRDHPFFVLHLADPATGLYRLRLVPAGAGEPPIDLRFRLRRAER